MFGRVFKQHKDGFGKCLEPYWHSSRVKVVCRIAISHLCAGWFTQLEIYWMIWYELAFFQWFCPHTLGRYPKLPQTPQRKKFLHTLLVKHPGYLPELCGWDLRILQSRMFLLIGELLISNDKIHSFWDLSLNGRNRRSLLQRCANNTKTPPCVFFVWHVLLIFCSLGFLWCHKHRRFFCCFFQLPGIFWTVFIWASQFGVRHRAEILDSLTP